MLILYVLKKSDVKQNEKSRIDKKVFSQNNFKFSSVKLSWQVLFIYIDIGNDDNTRIMEFFGLKADECPAVRYINLGDDMIKFKPKTGDLTESAISGFVQDVLDGKHKVCSY